MKGVKLEKDTILIGDSKTKIRKIHRTIGPKHCFSVTAYKRVHSDFSFNGKITHYWTFRA